MAGVGAGDSPPTLRLYQWDPPTISLGYFQKYEEFEALDPPACDLAVVRRLTGGGAILHDLELTYSLALPVDHDLLSSGATQLYAVAHDAVIAALRPFKVDAARCGASDDSGAGRGPFFCFERRHCLDVLMDREKLAGSAQRRTRQAVLQHGSIVLANRFAQQRTAALSRPFAQTVEHLRAAFPAEFARITGQAVEPGAWKVAELDRAKALIAKYAGAEWTRRS